MRHSFTLPFFCHNVCFSKTLSKLFENHILCYICIIFGYIVFCRTGLNEKTAFIMSHGRAALSVCLCHLPLLHASDGRQQTLLLLPNTSIRCQTQSYNPSTNLSIYISCDVDNPTNYPLISIPLSLYKPFKEADPHSSPKSSNKKNRLLHMNQSGFKPKYSCLTVIC